VILRKEVVPLSNINGELFDKIIPFKIYDCLPWEIEKIELKFLRKLPIYKIFIGTIDKFLKTGSHLDHRF